VTRVDWITLAIVVVAALAGLRRGLIAGLLSTGSGMVGSIARGRLISVPPLRALDSVGGAVLGAGLGLALVWVLGAVALQVPGQTQLRRAAQRSQVLRRLNAIVPPARLLQALHRVDPFPSITGPEVPSQPVDPSVLRDPAVRRAAPSVVRILGTACGLGISGSGWVARRGVVVTAAHVVAGEQDTVVEPPGSGERFRARAIAFDPRNDIALLSVPGLRARPLALAEPRDGAPVAIVGYPENGPLSASAARIGRTATVLTDNAYGRGPVARAITALSGRVRHGNSGGPAIDGAGAVETTVFAARIGGAAGYGVPAAVVRRALAGARSRVSTGHCA